MFAMVFTTRYLDLFTSFVSLYNSAMKVFFIVSSYATIYLMYSKFRATYDHTHDSFRVEFLVVPMAGLAVLVNHEFSLLEVLPFPFYPLFCKQCCRQVYRNTTPATTAPKIQPAGRCGNINSVDQLRHTRSVAYSIELVLLNKQQISGGRADLHC